jgi:hypothetical protein
MLFVFTPASLANSRNFAVAALAFARATAEPVFLLGDFNGMNFLAGLEVAFGGAGARSGGGEVQPVDGLFLGVARSSSSAGRF